MRVRAHSSPGGGERERACGRAPQPRAAPRPAPPASPELAPRALPGRLAPGPPPPSRGRGRGRRAAGFPSSAGAPGSASAGVPAPSSAGNWGRRGGARGSEGRRPGGPHSALGSGPSPPSPRCTAAVRARTAMNSAAEAPRARARGRCRRLPAAVRARSPAGAVPGAPSPHSWPAPAHARPR